MTNDSSPGHAPTLGAGAIGCVCRSEESLDAATAAFLGAGVAPEALHLGAADLGRAQAAAQRLGISADMHADDPLRDLIELEDDGTARGAVDRAGVLGAAIGAAAGVAISFTPAGHFIAAPAAALVLANAGLYFVLGTIVGSVLGAALAPQPSTHVAFRLIDGMQEGAFAILAVTPRERHDELVRALEKTGGTGITRI